MLDLPLVEDPRNWTLGRNERSLSDLEEGAGSLSRREEDDFLSLLEDWKEGLEAFLGAEAETTADVSLGRDFAISMCADCEASLEVWLAKSRISWLSKSLSDLREEESRDLRSSSDKEAGRSLAKCSLLRRRKYAKREDDKDIVSAMEPPRNLLMAFQRFASTGSNSVLRISFESTSSIHPTYD